MRRWGLVAGDLRHRSSERTSGRRCLVPRAECDGPARGEQRCVTVLNQIQHEQQYSNTNPLSRTH
jgi:hypothetical protein